MGELNVQSRGHTPVLMDEVLRLLDPRHGESILDCTAGLGGHATELARRIGPEGTLVLNELDRGNLARAAAAVRALPNPPRLIELHGNFAEAPRRLIEQGILADAVLADLGFSSNQVEEASRGFSFMRPGPLDMRLDPSGGGGGVGGSGVTAADLVNTLSEAELGEILRDFGEEKAWRRIAQKLIAERQVAPISTTDRLASIVRSVAGREPGQAGSSRIDPATKTFQALRIAVNDEMGSLRALLESVSRAMVPGGVAGGSWLASAVRIGIISFHSLEDRMVKEVFGDLVKRGLAEAVGRKPVEAEQDEINRNPRSRSAKLRVIRRIVDRPDLEGRLV